MAIFKTGGNFKSNSGHFYINFEYKTHLNFGGNFLKKKVHLIVCKIWYIYGKLKGSTLDLIKLHYFWEAWIHRNGSLSKDTNKNMHAIIHLKLGMNCNFHARSNTTALTEWTTTTYIYNLYTVKFTIIFSNFKLQH